MATDLRERDFGFTLIRSDDDTENDGLNFEGYAAVFNTPTRINDRDGEYDEVIAPGAFKQTINRGNPVLMFAHGRHPVIGPMPLGRITELREDARGLFVRARLTDNWLINPVRDAIRDGAITGMSFRFEAVKDQWTGKSSLRCRHGELRTVKEARVPELGPVVIPAYADTTAVVRSAFRELGEIEGVHVNIEVREGIETISTQEQTVLDLVKRAIKDRWGLPSSADVAVTDFKDEDNNLVFTVEGVEASEYSGLWRADYTYADGVVTLSSDPQAVQAVPASYAPRSLDIVEPSPTEPTEEVEEERTTGPSEEAAPSPSTEAAAQAPERASRAPMTSPAEREAFLREVELQRRGIKVGAR